MRTRLPGQRGVTIIEMMVSLVVVSIAVGFVFRIYATSSVAFRSQTQISEAQQTLRAARDKVMFDVRMAGYFSEGLQGLVDPTGGGFNGGGGPKGGTGDDADAFTYAPVSFINSADGPDELRVVYADTSCLSRVKCRKCPGGGKGCTSTCTEGGPPFNAAVTEVTQLSCFEDGDIAIAVRTRNVEGGSKKGDGCIMKITGLVGGGPKLQHNHGQGAPYNEVQNSQCANIEEDWADGYTMFLKFEARAYRIKPSDGRGILQVSESGGLVADDWQDIAQGIVDMQFAVLQYQPNNASDVDGDGATDEDGDGDPERDWISGENLENDLFEEEETVLQVRISMVGRTIGQVEGILTETLPAFMEGNDADNNELGDREEIDLAAINAPGTGDPDSTWYGSYVYRWSTTLVDLRNVGVGI